MKVSYEAVFDELTLEYRVEHLSYHDAIVLMASIGIIGPADAVKYTRYLERDEAIEEIYRRHSVSLVEARSREYELRFSAALAKTLVDNNHAEIHDVNACSNELQSDFKSIW